METKKLTELIKQLDEAIGGESSLTTYRGSLVLTATTLNELKEIKDQIIANAKSQAEAVESAKAFNIALIDRIKDVASIKFPDAIQVSNFPDSFKATGIPSKVKLDDDSIKQFVTKQDISEALLIDLLQTVKAIAKIVPNMAKYEGPTGEELRMILVDSKGKEYDLMGGLENMAKVLRSYGMGGSVPVTGGSSASIATTVGSGQTSVPGAGVRVQLPSVACTSVTIKAKSTNTGLIYVGGDTVDSATGFILASGDSVSLEIDNLNKLYIDSSVNDEGISYLYVAA